MSWPEYVANEFIRRTLTTVSTSTGDYQFCGVPFGSMLEVVVRAPDGSGGSTELIIGANAGVAVTDVRTGVRVTMSR